MQAIIHMRLLGALLFLSVAAAGKLLFCLVLLGYVGWKEKFHCAHIWNRAIVYVSSITTPIYNSTYFMNQWDEEAIQHADHRQAICWVGEGGTEIRVPL